MKILPYRERHMRDNIRDIIAVNPLASIRDLQRLLLNNTGRSMGAKYLSKLVREIQEDVVAQSDKKVWSGRLSEVRERNRALSEYLLRVIYWKPQFLRDYGLQRPSLKERMAAIKLISQMDLSLLRAETITGAFAGQEGRSMEIEERFVGISRTIRVGGPVASALPYAE